MRIRVFSHYELPNYPKDLDLVLSDKGYGRQDYVDTKSKIVVVTAPGPCSGKFSFCMAQLYNDRRKRIMSGFSKFETFPVWNLSLDHPLNVAYEAAKADIGIVTLWTRSIKGHAEQRPSTTIEMLRILQL